MPAPYARRDPIQALARAVNRNSPGQAQGRFRGLSPAAAAMTQPSRTDPSIGSNLELHHIEGWSIADDTDDTFALDFEPLLDSWNLELNGIRVHRSEFSIAGHVLTIANPTDLFLGADEDPADPWDLEIQYDYLNPGVGAAPSSLHTRVDKGTTSTAAVAFTSFTAAVDTLILYAVANANGGTPAVPTGYTQVATVTESGLRLTVFAKTAVGTETSVSSVISGSAGSWCGMVVNYEASTVIDSATASAPASVTLTSGSVSAPLAVDFVAGLTTGFHSGSTLQLDATLTGLDTTFIGYLGLKVGESSTASGGFVDFWGVDGFGGLAQPLASIVVGLEA